MTEQLASLLLPIEALLTHGDYNPVKNASPEITALFRNFWFLCVLFSFTNVDTADAIAMDWLKPALGKVAIKTPPMVLEDASDVVASDVEYNSILRQEYANTVGDARPSDTCSTNVFKVISKHRATLTNYIAIRASDIRYLSIGEVIFLLALHDIENMRSAAGHPSSLVQYFTNASINAKPGLVACMDSIAEKVGFSIFCSCWARLSLLFEVIRDCTTSLNSKASQQALPKQLSHELRNLLVASTHRIEKARDIASKYLHRLITSFPSLMCDPSLVFAILEVLTLLRKASENEFLDEVSMNLLLRRR